MAQAARTSSVDRFTSPSGLRDRMPNSVDHRFKGNAAHRHYKIVHRVADRGVVLRRIATRRRLARIDPETVERRARRLTGVSPTVSGMIDRGRIDP